MRGATWGARFGVLLAALSLVGTLVPPAFAKGEQSQAGQSTPGVIVSAQNPGTSDRGSSTRLILTAGTTNSNGTSLSCRPPDANFHCWGALVLRIPALGGFSVTGFELHRVAVGDISCGGCEEGEAAGDVAADVDDTQAQVNGVAVVTNPGTATVDKTGAAVRAGDEVQLKITLTIDGAALYEDTADVVINQFEEGPDKPRIYDTGVQTIQRVRIHFRATSSSSQTLAGR